MGYFFPHSSYLGLWPIFLLQPKKQSKTDSLQTRRRKEKVPCKQTTATAGCCRYRHYSVTTPSNSLLTCFYLYPHLQFFPLLSILLLLLRLWLCVLDFSVLCLWERFRLPRLCKHFQKKTIRMSFRKNLFYPYCGEFFPFISFFFLFNYMLNSNGEQDARFMAKSCYHVMVSAIRVNVAEIISNASE